MSESQHPLMSLMTILLDADRSRDRAGVHGPPRAALFQSVAVVHPILPAVVVFVVVLLFVAQLAAGAVLVVSAFTMMHAALRSELEVSERRARLA